MKLKSLLFGSAAVLAAGTGAQAADLPVALALISSLKDVPIAEDVAAFGELGLAGELRSVANADARVSEAARLGFTRVLLPYANLTSVTKRDGVTVIGVRNIREAYDAL